jgi:phosphoribosylaminoimidazole-succinocarboxamide synthase
LHIHGGEARVEKPVLQTNLAGLELINRGKVRDIYRVGEDLLIVATDRISAFDCILPTGIPYKGKVLTALSLFWFDLLKDVTENHLITASVEKMPETVHKHAVILRGRTMLVRKAEIIPIECVVRGYLAGSGWKEYRQNGMVCGIRLPAGLRESDALPEPIFTPATKATTGHDENVSFERAAEVVGADTANELRRRTLEVYQKASAYARQRGIIISDTKFEWGRVQGRMVLADEVLTPDSSRFWPADKYAPGGPQPSFDKQFVRDYLETLNWDKRPPAPPLPEAVVRQTSQKYLEAYERLTGKRLV